MANLREKGLDHLAKQTMMMVEGYRSNFAYCSKQAAFSGSKTVQFCSSSQCFVNTPTTFCTGKVYAWLCEVRRVCWQSVNHLSEQSDDNAFTIQLQWCTESED